MQIQSVSFKPFVTLLLWLTPLFVAHALAACSSLPPPPIGKLSLALSSGVGPFQHRLRNAHFEVSGTESLSLDSEDNPLLNELQRALPTGEYALRLLDGWQIESSETGTPEPVAAQLVSDNPLSFEIAAGAVTNIVYRFQTAQGPVELAVEGQLNIGIEVDGIPAAHVLFSEVMNNPVSLADTSGEWIELYNAGSQAVDLGGCLLARDTQTVSLDSPLRLEAGAYLTLANDAQPGFSPDVVYSGLNLPNSGEHVLQLTCGQQLLDQWLLDSDRFASSAGQSASLDPTELNAIANDDPQNWCNGSTPYGGDLGSPGQPNPPCF